MDAWTLVARTSSRPQWLVVVGEWRLVLLCRAGLSVPGLCLGDLLRGAQRRFRRLLVLLPRSARILSVCPHLSRQLGAGAGSAGRRIWRRRRRLWSIRR